jgi:hypothetical protein
MGGIGAAIAECHPIVVILHFSIQCQTVSTNSVKQTVSQYSVNKQCQTNSFSICFSNSIHHLFFKQFLNTVSTNSIHPPFLKECQQTVSQSVFQTVSTTVSTTVFKTVFIICFSNSISRIYKN